MTYNFGKARKFVLAQEIIMVIVTSGPQIARLARCFVIEGHVPEAEIFGQRRAGCVHRLLQKVDVLPRVGDEEVSKLCCALLRRPKVQVCRSHPLH